MKEKITHFISDFSYTLIANIISFFASLLIITIIPKLLGVTEYGYFQLYSFYTTYVILFHFGLPNGIYLRYGGKEYDEMDKGVFTVQFWMLILYSIVIASVGSVIFALTMENENKRFILIMVCLCGLIIIPRDFILLTLQATNRIKDYVKATIIDRIVYITIVLLFLSIGDRSYLLIIKADLIAKVIALLWLICRCKDIVLRRVSNIWLGVAEAVRNLTSGSKIMASNVVDMLIIGIIRMGIEKNWDINTFGKVSLTLSLSNIMMIGINAISIVIYPILRRIKIEEISKIYSILRNLLMIPLLGSLIVYYPMKELLALWLPRYGDSLTYIALLFPICIYESKMGMLVNTYLKSIRKEKWILIVNLVAMVLSVITSMITIFLLNNLVLALISLVFVLAFRCIFAELLLTRWIQIQVRKDIILELLLCIAFMMSGWFIQSILSTLIYAVCYFIYFFIKRKDMLNSIFEIKKVLKDNREA